MRAVLVKVSRSFAFARVGGPDVFVHFASCGFKLADCREGDLIDIAVLVTTPKGLRAAEEPWPSVTFVKRPS
jgi:cold shock CspA family protein